jgi:lysophospholipase L1-like esterase
MTEPSRWIRCLAVLVAAATGPAAAESGRIDAPPLDVYKLILVGDSTTAPHSGWGGAFCANHVKWRIACLNLGRGARSTRSYRSEGAWDIALGEMRVPGYKKVYVVIQLGHNDQARHKPERWTEETKEFPDNLRRFVREARKAGAVPILVTPLSRRDFRDGQLHNTLASWSEQVRKVAAELKAPLIDLNAKSAQAVQELGAVAAMDWAQAPPSEEEVGAARAGTTLPAAPNPPEVAEDRSERAGAPPGARGRIRLKFDYTHLGAEGAKLIAATMADELALAVPELAALIVPAGGAQPQAAQESAPEPSGGATAR